jgi:pyridoxamine 5'-phosphate oxidase
MLQKSLNCYFGIDIEQKLMTKDSQDPFELFGEWFAKAGEGETIYPEAMALATADAKGLPSLRMVLLKGWDQNGFVFYTNLESHKGQDLAENPHAALCFHWKTQGRQVRVEGAVEQVSDAEADAYYESRPRDSRIGAWASRQSRPLQGPMKLEREVIKYAAKFGVGHIPRPPYWSGFRVVPQMIEFWEEKPFRLHDRLVFRLQDSTWVAEKLFP